MLQKKKVKGQAEVILPGGKKIKSGKRSEE